MKKIVFGSMVAAAALASTPAMAQSVNGTVNITANVPGKCQVVSPGPAGSSFTTNVDLGDISDTDGTLLPTAQLEALFNAGGVLADNMAFQVVCNTANPFVTVDADPIVTGAAAGAGYANRVDYTAVVQFTTLPGSTTFNHSTTAGSPLSSSLNGRLVTGQNNVVITANSFSTANATDVLIAGAYTGLISITIAPTT